MSTPLRRSRVLDRETTASQRNPDPCFPMPLPSRHPVRLACVSAHGPGSSQVLVGGGSGAIPCARRSPMLPESPRSRSGRLTSLSRDRPRRPARLARPETSLDIRRSRLAQVADAPLTFARIDADPFEPVGQLPPTFTIGEQATEHVDCAWRTDLRRPVAARTATAVLSAHG